MPRMSRIREPIHGRRTTIFQEGAKNTISFQQGAKTHAISDENFGSAKQLNLNCYHLKHGLSCGVGICRLAAFLFEQNVPKSGAHEAIAPTSRRYFRRKFWPQEKTEPLSLPFKASAFT